MNYKNNSAKNLYHPSFYLPQSPQNYLQKQSFSSSFIDNTTVSIDDDYQLEAQSIISNLNKMSYHMHMVSQITIDRLQQTIIGFYNQCILPFKNQLKKQPNTPQFQQHPFPFTPKQKKPPVQKSIIQSKKSQLQEQMLKIQKLKKQLKQDNLKKKNISELKSIQNKYINKNKVADIYFYLNKFLKQILTKVEKPETIQKFIPHIKDIYQQVYKMVKEQSKISQVLEDYQRQVEYLLESQGNQDSQEDYYNLVS